MNGSLIKLLYNHSYMVGDMCIVFVYMCGETKSGGEVMGERRDRLI